MISFSGCLNAPWAYGFFVYGDFVLMNQLLDLSGIVYIFDFFLGFVDCIKN